MAEEEENISYLPDDDISSVIVLWQMIQGAGSKVLRMLPCKTVHIMSVFVDNHFDKLWLALILSQHLSY